MPLTKPNQQLRRNLKLAVALLEEAAHDLFEIAKRHHESGFLAVMEKIAELHEQADKLAGYADEVKAGQINRGNPE